MLHRQNTFNVKTQSQPDHMLKFEIFYEVAFSYDFL